MCRCVLHPLLASLHAGGVERVAYHDYVLVEERQCLGPELPTCPGQRMRCLSWLGSAASQCAYHLRRGSIVLPVYVLVDGIAKLGRKSEKLGIMIVVACGHYPLGLETQVGHTYGEEVCHVKLSGCCASKILC